MLVESASCSVDGIYDENARNAFQVMLKWSRRRDCDLGAIGLARGLPLPALDSSPRITPRSRPRLASRMLGSLRHCAAVAYEPDLPILSYITVLASGGT